MKEICFYLFMIFAVYSFVYADSGEVVFTPGGNVEPVQNKYIRMMNEQINITLYDDYIKVKVDYRFQNTGDKQKVIMGFPNSKSFSQGGEIIYGINDFKSFDGGKEFKVFRKDKEGEKGKSPADIYECFEVEFSAGETKNITNTYSQVYNKDNNDNIFTGYILKTGALWKGNIDLIIVLIKSELPADRMKNKTAYFLDDYDKCKIIKIDFNFSIMPQKYSVLKDIIKMEFKDIKPDFDIKIVIPPKYIKSISASSELKDKNYQYSVKNLIDGNPETVWVEGKNDYGINEYIELATNPFYANSAGAYKIKKIGIINGFVKNKNLFEKNSRVKKIRIDCENYLCPGDCCNDKSSLLRKKTSEVYSLKDIMEMQYIEFKEPVYTSSIKITILEVYEGTKWKDTCLSEIKLFGDE